MNGENSNFITKAEVEEAKREEMRELLIEAFDEKSVLYEIYKKRGWLDKLFTDKILSMDKDALYISNQVADICDTHDYVIKNKRKDLLDYINPIVMGDGNAKIYKHNYISVFKLKMIDGLTGDGAEYTLPQLRGIIYSNIGSLSTEKKTQPGNDAMFHLIKKVEKLENFYNMVNSGEFFDEVEKRAQIAAKKLLLEDSGEIEAKKNILSIYEQILSSKTDLEEKDRLLLEYTVIEEKYPQLQFSISMYRNAAEDRITKFRQDEREIFIRKLKEDVVDLFEDFEKTDNESEKETIKDKLFKISENNPDLSYEIRYWFSLMRKEKKKKGLFSRLFS